MKKIPLTQGEFALVDDEDYEYLVRFSWYALKCGKRIYARTGQKINGKRGHQMHRLILSVPVNLEIDHANHNGLDNRKGNLRICNRSQNMANGRREKGISGYRGVVFDKIGNRWRVLIKVKGANVHGGFFNSKRKAAYKYDELARLHFGEFATLNFPRSNRKEISDE